MALLAICGEGDPRRTPQELQNQLLARPLATASVYKEHVKTSLLGYLWEEPRRRRPQKLQNQILAGPLATTFSTYKEHVKTSCFGRLGGTSGGGTRSSKIRFRQGSWQPRFQYRRNMLKQPFWPFVGRATPGGLPRSSKIRFWQGPWRRRLYTRTM